MEGSVLMVYFLDTLPMVSKELGKTHFKATMSQTTEVEGGAIVTSGLLGLRADFGFEMGRLGLWALGAGKGSLVLDRKGPL